MVRFGIQCVGVLDENLGDIEFRDSGNLILHIDQMVAELGADRLRHLTDRRGVGGGFEGVNHLKNGEVTQLTAVAALQALALRVHKVAGRHIF